MSEEDPTLTKGIVSPDSDFDYNSIVEETVVHAGQWKIPLRNLSAWSFEETGSGYIILYIIGSMTLPDTTYARTEEELEEYLTARYNTSVAKYLMEGRAQNG